MQTKKVYHPQIFFYLCISENRKAMPRNRLGEKLTHVWVKLANLREKN